MNVLSVAADLIPISRGQSVADALTADGVPPDLVQSVRSEIIGFYVEPSTGGDTVKFSPARDTSKTRTVKTGGTTFTVRPHDIEADSVNVQHHLLIRG